MLSVSEGTRRLVKFWLTCLLFATTNALPVTHINAQVNAAIVGGTFESPSANVRPRFRYWLPDASVDPDKVAEDIQEIGIIGAGGIEFLPYYLYGGVYPSHSPTPDWNLYGYGTPAYNAVLKAALQSHKDYGLIMDLSFGPQSGQGVPVENLTNPGLIWQVSTVNTTISAGTTFNGTIPGFGAGYLVSCVAAKLLQVTTRPSPNVTGIYSDGPIITTVTYSSSSLADITNNVTDTGQLVFSPSDGETYLIMASYAMQPLTQACIPAANPTSWLTNGSFIVDHFSASGAKITTDFMETHVLVNGVKELFVEVGNYVWEDSVELFVSAYWTPDLPSVFEQLYGYSISQFAPLLAKDNGEAFGKGTNVYYQSDDASLDESIVQAYRQTLTYLYKTRYMAHFEQWAHDYLDVQYSHQAGYGFPVDVASGAPVPDAPELETLAFGNYIDAFRQYSGPANLAGRRIISCELAAEYEAVYQQTLPTLINDAARAFAGGSNNMIIHGSPYSHDYFETSWPGYTSFAYSYAEQHTRHQPAWELGYSDMLNWMGRNQFVLQSGVPKRDIAFWNKHFGYYSAAQYTPLCQLPDLLDAGYSYEYLSPDNFQLSQAVVENGVLAPEGPGYKALIILANQTMTDDGIAKLYTFAEAGLPLIFYGGLPSNALDYNNSSDASSTSELAGLQKYPNVHIIGDGTLASSLQTIGIEPLTRVNVNTTLWTNWRHDEAAGIDYVYIYNDSPGSSTGTITFASQNIPYEFNAWTGEQNPILAYTTSAAGITIPISLASNQTRLIAFSKSPLDPTDNCGVHIDESNIENLYTSYSPATGLVVKITTTNDLQNSIINISDGPSHKLSCTTPAPSFTLTDYTLTVEHWSPPSNLSDIETIAIKHNTTHSLATLVPWSQIPGLTNTSGIGYYSTTFTWPPSTDGATGAFIDFGAIIHSICVSINGRQLPPLDFRHAEADIGAYLVDGLNVVDVRVATTLGNVLRGIWFDLRTSGTYNTIDVPVEADMGLLGEVVVTPYVEVRVA